MAWVVPRDGAAVDAGVGRGVLPRAHRALQGPALLEIVDEFPMTVTGKVQKFRMREMAVEALGLEEAAGVRTA